MNREGCGYLGAGRVELLEHIDECGSIARAAKRMGMSYKTAWDAVEAMNNLADRPLVVRATGGKGGGGTQLTDLREAGDRRLPTHGSRASAIPGPYGGWRERFRSDQ
ncbi:MAG: LysR family transcriptional regulator [Candidatus Competibacteraceae bacterium]